MNDERVVGEIVTKFLLNTCRLRPKLSLPAVQAAVHCAAMSTLKPRRGLSYRTPGNLLSMLIKPVFYGICKRAARFLHIVVSNSKVTTGAQTASWGHRVRQRSSYHLLEGRHWVTEPRAYAGGGWRGYPPEIEKKNIIYSFKYGAFYVLQFVQRSQFHNHLITIVFID